MDFNVLENETNFAAHLSREEVEAIVKDFLDFNGFDIEQYYFDEIDYTGEGLDGYNVCVKSKEKGDGDYIRLKVGDDGIIYCGHYVQDRYSVEKINYDDTFYLKTMTKALSKVGLAERFINRYALQQTYNVTSDLIDKANTIRQSIGGIRRVVGKNSEYEKFLKNIIKQLETCDDIAFTDVKKNILKKINDDSPELLN